MSGLPRTALLLVSVLAALATATARVLRVPWEYGTIQSALDSLHDTDTVLVSVGTYHEALNAPGMTFTLKGDVVPDTGEYPRPLIDPSALPGSRSLACLTIDIGSHPVLEDLRFRNGPEMYPRQAPGMCGGIICYSVDPIIRRCLLDSLYLGFTGLNDSNTVITAEYCQFRQDSGSCLYDFRSVKHLSSCSFSGHGDRLVSLSSHSRVSHCSFFDNWQDMVVAFGNDIEIDSCKFGPYGARFIGFSPLLFTGR